jgi:hypothetical protein
VVAAVVALAGCGGGGDDRLTKAEYIAQADAICQEANAKIEALGAPETLADLAAMGQQSVQISEQQLAKLRALRPPAEDEATLNGAYDLVEQQIGITKQLVAAARAKDMDRINSLVAQGNDITKQAGKIAGDYGLRQCGSS